MKKTFEFEWDENELGNAWMNIDNLALCLFSKEHTRRELITIREAAEALAASRLELLRRAAEFLRDNNPNHPLLKEIEKELGDD